MSCFCPNTFEMDQMAFKTTQCVPCCYYEQQPSRKGKKKLKGYKPPQTPPGMKAVVYEPCVHRHFKPEHIDRECLTREQYYDLLATPKGYPWLGEADCQNPELQVKTKSKKKKKHRLTEPEECPVRADAGDFADEFVEDMWDVMSPEITCRLIDFLVNEFGMSVEEAEDFIDCKSCVGKQTTCKKKKSKTSIGLGPRYKWVKEFSDVFSKRIEQYIVSMLLTRRTPRTKKIAERILECLCDLTGEKSTLQNPKTKIQKIMVLISDRLALWIDDIMNDIDKPHKKRISITEEEEAKEETEEEDESKEEEVAEDEKNIPKDEKPEKEEEKREEKEDKTEEVPPEKEVEKEPEPVQDKPQPEKEVEKEPEPAQDEPQPEPEKDVEKEPEPVQDKPQPEKEVEKEPEPAQDEPQPEPEKEVKKEPEPVQDEPQPEPEKDVEKEPEPVQDKPQPEPEKEVEKEPEPVQDEPQPEREKEEPQPTEEEKIEEPVQQEDEPKAEDKPPPEEKTPEDKTEEPATEETPTDEKTKPTEEPEVAPAENEEVPITSEKGEPAQEEIPAEEEKPAEEEEPNINEPKAEEKVSEEKIEEEQDQEQPETVKEEVEKEQEKKPYGDVLDLVKEDIEGTPKDKRTDRQKADKDEVIRRIEKQLAGKDLDIQSEDIDDAASRVAHWMEHVLGSTEPAGGVRGKNPSPAYAVSLKSGSTLEVHKLSSGTVAHKTADARGVLLPPRVRKIPETTSPMNLKSTQEWFDWTNSIGAVIDEWGTWMESKLTDAERQILEKKKADPDFDFKKWRDQAQTEAHKWRSEKQKIKGEGNLWNKKMDGKLKDQPETEVRSIDM